MEKKNNKFEVTIIFIVIVFSIIMYGLYLVVNEYYKKYAFTLITSPLTILECKKWDCTDKTSEVSKYNNKEYNTNIDGKDIGKNTMYYDSFQKRFYIFDYKDNSIKYNNSFYMYEGSISGILLDKNEVSTLELETIKSKLKLKFSLNQVTYSEKVMMDFDGDSNIEEVYSVIGGALNYYFSYLVYNKEEKYYILYKSEENDITKFSAGTISNTLDIFNDGKKEFMYHISYYDEIGECNVLYRIKGKKFVNVNECNVK